MVFIGVLGPSDNLSLLLVQKSRNHFIQSGCVVLRRTPRPGPWVNSPTPLLMVLRPEITLLSWTQTSSTFLITKTWDRYYSYSTHREENNQILFIHNFIIVIKIIIAIITNVVLSIITLILSLFVVLLMLPRVK